MRRIHLGPAVRSPPREDDDFASRRRGRRGWCGPERTRQMRRAVGGRHLYLRRLVGPDSSLDAALGSEMPGSRPGRGMGSDLERAKGEALAGPDPLLQAGATQARFFVRAGGGELGSRPQPPQPPASPAPPHLPVPGNPGASRPAPAPPGPGTPAAMAQPEAASTSSGQTGGAGLWAGLGSRGFRLPASGLAPTYHTEFKLSEVYVKADTSQGSSPVVIA